MPADSKLEAGYWQEPTFLPSLFRGEEKGTFLPSYLLMPLAQTHPILLSSLESLPSLGHSLSGEYRSGHCCWLSGLESEAATTDLGTWAYHSAIPLF